MFFLSCILTAVLRIDRDALCEGANPGKSRQANLNDFYVTYEYEVAESHGDNLRGVASEYRG